MIVKVELLYGGKVEFDVKDKVTKQKTGEKQYLYNLLEVDKEKNVVNSAQYFLKNDIDTSEFQLLKPVIAEIDLSVSSNFKILINLEKKC